MTAIWMMPKRCCLCVLVILAGVLIAEAMPTQEAELIELNKRLTEAYENEDVEVLQALLAEDHVHNNIFGMSLTKEKLLEDIRSGTLAFEYYRTPELRFVFESDELYIATGRIEAKAARSGADVGAINFCFTRVFVKRDGRWQSLLFHNTKIVPPPMKKPMDVVA